MKRCERCGIPAGFPSAEDIGIKLEGRVGSARGWTMFRIYAALQRPGGVTADELRMSAWPTGEKRAWGTIFVMLARLDRRLVPFRLAIARVGIGRGDRTYRLVGL